MRIFTSCSWIADVPVVESGLGTMTAGACAVSGVGVAAVFGAGVIGLFIGGVAVVAAAPTGRAGAATTGAAGGAPGNTAPGGILSIGTFTYCVPMITNTE